MLLEVLQGGPSAAEAPQAAQAPAVRARQAEACRTLPGEVGAPQAVGRTHPATGWASAGAGLSARALREDAEGSAAPVMARREARPAAVRDAVAERAVAERAVHRRCGRYASRARGAEEARPVRGRVLSARSHQSACPHGRRPAVRCDAPARSAWAAPMTALTAALTAVLTAASMAVLTAASMAAQTAAQTARLKEAQPTGSTARTST